MCVTRRRRNADGSAIDYWNLFIPPALAARPSALSRLIDPDNDTNLTSDPEFTPTHLELWIEFHRKKARAISRDTWSLFIEFIRTIDAKFETYDENGTCQRSNPHARHADADRQALGHLRLMIS